MTQGRRPLIPEWAAQERLSDLAWIQENLNVFWTAAEAQYRREGRGAIVVDTTVRPTGAGNPFTCLARAEVTRPTTTRPSASCGSMIRTPRW